MADRYRLDIDESAIYEGENRVLKLDTDCGTGNFSNNNWRKATALGARIVEFLNATAGVKAAPAITRETIAEWRAQEGEGMVSVLGEYAPAEFWKLLDAYETLAYGVSVPRHETQG